jgi:hypothetical protein
MYILASAYFTYPKGMESWGKIVCLGDWFVTSCTYEWTCVEAANDFTNWASQTDYFQKPWAVVPSAQIQFSNTYIYGIQRISLIEVWNLYPCWQSGASACCDREMRIMACVLRAEHWNVSRDFGMHLFSKFRNLNSLNVLKPDRLSIYNTSLVYQGSCVYHLSQWPNMNVKY